MSVKTDPQTAADGDEALQAGPTIRVMPRTEMDESEQIAPGATRADRIEMPEEEVVFDLRDLSCFYGDFRAVRDISLRVQRNKITALIGPSGCGKSTLLRSFNRMNDLVESAHVTGEILYHGVNLYADGIDPVQVRRRIGMVFQKPNPFPKSIYDNIAFGPKVAGFKGSRKDLDDLVERSLRRAAIWDEVKDKLQAPGTAL